MGSFPDTVFFFFSSQYLISTGIGASVREYLCSLLRLFDESSCGAVVVLTPSVRPKCRFCSGGRDVLIRADHGLVSRKGRGGVLSVTEWGGRGDKVAGFTPKPALFAIIQQDEGALAKCRKTNRRKSDRVSTGAATQQAFAVL